MRCTCPMGGERECPDDCPQRVWHTLSKSEQSHKAKRKPVVEAYYRKGYIQKEIATILGVAQSVVSDDLKDFNLSESDKLKSAKSASNPKGAGRPKGKKKTPEIADKHDKIIALADAGMKSAEIAEQVGVGPRMVDRVLEVENARRDGEKAEHEVSLSMTAQQRLDAAIRAHKTRLDAEFEIRLREECMRHLNDIALPQYLKEISAIERSIRDRRGIMDRITYRKILSCLHPDRVQDQVLKKRYEEAFRLFTELEKRVLNEKESPTPFRNMPKTAEELMRMKAKVQAERRARREAAKGAKNVSHR